MNSLRKHKFEANFRTRRTNELVRNNWLHFIFRILLSQSDNDLFKITVYRLNSFNTIICGNDINFISFDLAQMKNSVQSIANLSLSTRALG